MFWPVFMDQVVGRFFSVQMPWPVGPRNWGQSSARALAASWQWHRINKALAANCQWHRRRRALAASCQWHRTIDPIRMIVITRRRRQRWHLNGTFTDAEITDWKLPEPRDAARESADMRHTSP